MSATPQPGDRIRMVGTMINDPAPIPVGEEGTVREVHPGVGQIYVEWDSGRSLILLTIDPFTIIGRESDG